MENYTNLINNTTNIIFSVIVAWYLMAKAIPNLQESFSKDLKSQRDDFIGALKEERVDFDQMINRIMTLKGIKDK